MPITLPPISRRRFLSTSLAGVATMVLGQGCTTTSSSAAAGRDPDRVALLSDIHCPANPKSAERGVNMTEHLRQAVGQVLELEKSDRPPAAAIISGDCAYHTGETGDYQALLGVLSPLNSAGLPIHLAMGNHDQRQRFWTVLPHDKLGNGAGKRLMNSRQALLLRSPKVDWVVLDSLDKVNATPGLLGAEQLQWLKGILDAPERSGKPTIVVLHHDPVAFPKPRPANAKPSTRPAQTTGLVDGPALMELLLPRKQVKAVVYGHTHVWETRPIEGLHMINLPAVAYVFDKAQPSAWTEACVSDQGMRLQLHCLNDKHPRQGEVIDLAWRT